MKKLPEIIEVLAKMIFRASVLVAVLMMWEPHLFWLPLSVIIGFCSEAKFLTS